jgi:hypothetical protein
MFFSKTGVRDRGCERQGALKARLAGKPTSSQATLRLFSVKGLRGSRPATTPPFKLLLDLAKNRFDAVQCLTSEKNRDQKILVSLQLSRVCPQYDVG